MFPFSEVIVVCWIAFWIYWLISALGSKKNVTSSFKQFIIIRFTVILLVSVLFRLLNVKDYSFHNRIATSNELILAIGFIMFLAGLSVAIWARISMGKNWGMPMSIKQSPELVVSGPYRYIRHPIYTGILLAMIGSAISSSLFWLALFGISGIYFIYSAVKEEELMMRQFPEVYPSYRSKTKMLIPFVI